MNLFGFLDKRKEKNKDKYKVPLRKEDLEYIHKYKGLEEELKEFIIESYSLKEDAPFFDVLIDFEINRNEIIFKYNGNITEFKKTPGYVSFGGYKFYFDKWLELYPITQDEIDDFDVYMEKKAKRRENEYIEFQNATDFKRDSKSFMLGHGRRDMNEYYKMVPE